MRLPISLADFDPEKGIDWRPRTPGRRRASLNGFIKRIEVGPYPEGMRRTRRRLKNETEQQYLDARHEIVKITTTSGIQIRWKWDAE